MLQSTALIVWLQQVIGPEIPSGNGELNRQCLGRKCWLHVAEEAAVLGAPCPSVLVGSGHSCITAVSGEYVKQIN